MRTRPPSALLYAILSAALLGPCGPALAQNVASPGELAFDDGMVQVHALMEKSKWAEAHRGLDKLLVDHANQLYVTAQRDAIQFDMQMCCLYEKVAMPKIEDLLSGQVIAFVPATGHIKLKYTRSTLADWTQEGELLLHPLVFAGTYSITLSGKNYPADTSLQVFFDLEVGGETYYAAGFGTAPVNGASARFPGIPASVGRGKGQQFDILERDKSWAQANKPFVATLRVSKAQVELLLDRKSMLRTKRQKAEFGQFGVLPGTFDEIVLEGDIEPAWMQGRMDESLSKQREAFEKDFQIKKVLPAWLFAAPNAARTPKRSASWLPGTDGRISEGLAAVLDSYRAGAITKAKEALSKLTDADVPAITRDYLDARFLLAGGRPEAASVPCERALQREPTSSPLRVVRAEILEATGRTAMALPELFAAIESDPGEDELYETACLLLMQKGRNAEASQLLRSGKVRHGLWQELAPLDKMLAMAQRGPAFARRYVHRSTHYEIVSDIDAKVGPAAATVLEEAYVNLMSQFVWLKEEKDFQRFRVFLFSGEASYQDYCKAILGNAVPQTAGLYSPVLKQLLIWNLPVREDMERTIRHEGFHQFLDRVMEAPPVWLNEGMAEFWERAQREGGKFQGGQVRKDHIATLMRSRAALPKLEDFVYGERADFYANAPLRYAQGWALVHFLRKGPAEQNKRFQTLWQQLRTPQSTRTSLDAAFAGVDWKKFETDFWTYLITLR